MKKHFLIATLILCLTSIFILGGCRKETVIYPNVLAWDDISYGISNIEVSKDELGKQLGEIKRKKQPLPMENGDANNTPIGSKLFEIKGTDTKDAIAVEKNDKFYKVIKKGPLKQ